MRITHFLTPWDELCSSHQVPFYTVLYGFNQLLTNPIDRDIDMFSDTDSDTELSEEKQIIQNYVDETKLDDNYYLSFFK